METTGLYHQTAIDLVKLIHDTIEDINSLRPIQNGWHFTDDIFTQKSVFNENLRVLYYWNSLKFVPEGECWFK